MKRTQQQCTRNAERGPRGSAPVAAVAGIALTLGAGCTVGGRTNLAAADAIDVVAQALARQLTEYHEETHAEDRARTQRAVDALIHRLRTDADDDRQVAAHRDAFLRAVQRIDADEHTQWRRHQLALDQLAILREVAEGLRRIARESASIEDEFRRHVIPLLGGLARSEFGQREEKDHQR